MEAKAVATKWPRCEPNSGRHESDSVVEILLKATPMLLRILQIVPLLGLLCWPAMTAAQNPIPDDLVITLQRGNCGGSCPVSTEVVIFANGDVIWQGRGQSRHAGSAPEPD